MPAIHIASNLPTVGKKVADSPIIRTRPFSYDPLTGMRKEFHFHADGSWTISSKQDVEPIIDVNKFSQNEAREDWKGEMHKVASIPMEKYMELMQLGILQDEKKFKTWLNDPDNRFYRTKLGRI